MKKLLIGLLLLVSSFGFAQNMPNYWVPTSGTDTYTTGIPTWTGSYNNKVGFVKFGNANTGAATINVNSFGAANLRKWSGSAWVALSAGDIKTNTIYRISYDNTNTYFTIEGGNLGGSSGSSTTRNKLPPVYETSDFTLVPGDTSRMIIMEDNVTTLTLGNFATGVDGSQFVLHNSQNSNVTIDPDGQDYIGSLTIGDSTFAYIYFASDTFRISSSGSGSGGSGTVTDVTGSAPIVITGTSTVTPNVTITDAAADATTKGASTYTAADFNATSGLIAIDYTNGQAASGSNKGFLTSADWTTFNNKQASISFGTGVLTALGVNIGSAGAPVLFNGAGGTPSSMTGTNITGTASGLTAGSVTTIPTLSGDVTNSGNAITVTKINGTALSGLATGILKNTTSTGVPSIAVAADFPALSYYSLATGGAASGVNTFTSNAVNQLLHTGTWTMATTLDTHERWGGNFTGKGTSGGTTLGYVFDPTLTAGSTGQTIVGVQINPVMNATNAPNRYQLVVGSLTTGTWIDGGSIFGLGSTLNFGTSATTRLAVASVVEVGASASESTASFTVNSNVNTTSGGKGHIYMKSALGNATPNASANYYGINSDAAITSNWSNSANFYTASYRNTFAPSGSSSVFTVLDGAPVLNASAGTTTVTGFDWHPTETSMTGITHYGVRVRSTTALNGFGLSAPTATLHAVGSIKLDGNVTLPTVGNKISIKEGSGGFMGQTTLVSGTKAVTVTGVTTSTRCFLTRVTPSGTTLTTDYDCVCTANTVTIQADIAAGTINTADGSTLNYMLFEPAP